MYVVFSLLPLIFHDAAWATIAYLRHLIVTDNSNWLELDQEVLKSRTGRLTWLLTAAKVAFIIPSGRYLLFNQGLEKTATKH